jgi:hypothetical protein
MTALDNARTAPRLASTTPEVFQIDLVDDAIIYQGALVCVDTADDNLGKRGAASTTLIAVGIAQSTVDNTNGGDRGASVEVRSGAYRFENSAAADEVTADDHLFKVVYIVDDQTVAATDGTGTRSPAGIVVGFEGSRPIVWVSPFLSEDIRFTAAAIAVATA